MNRVAAFENDTEMEITTLETELRELRAGAHAFALVASDRATKALFYRIKKCFSRA